MRFSNLPTADIAEVKKKLTVHGVSVVAEGQFQVLTKLLYISGYVSPAATFCWRSSSKPAPTWLR